MVILSLILQMHSFNTNRRFSICIFDIYRKWPLLEIKIRNSLHFTETLSLSETDIYMQYDTRLSTSIIWFSFFSSAAMALSHEK